MDYDNYIFDLDYTLLIPDWSKEDEYFEKNIQSEILNEFLEKKQGILDEYELKFPRYDFKTLSEFFKTNGFDVSEDIIEGWMIHNSKEIKDEIADGVIELFEYLKQNNKQITILTGWFSGTQIERLKRTGLFKYIDKIVSGDDAMKPDLESFELAIKPFDKSKCIMIGDSITSDVDGAKNAGIDYYHISKENSIRDLYNSLIQNNIKKM